jgi:hypothetical protein
MELLIILYINPFQAQFLVNEIFVYPGTFVIMYIAVPCQLVLPIVVSSICSFSFVCNFTNRVIWFYVPVVITLCRQGKKSRATIFTG